MNGYLLERLTSCGWRRTGELFWTLQTAEKEARRILRRKAAQLVRILPVTVSSDAVTTVEPKRSGPRLRGGEPERPQTEATRE